MLIRPLLFIAVLVLLSWGGAWLMDNRGEVQIVWLGQVIETTVAFLIAVLATSVLLLLAMVQLVLWVFNLPERWKYGRTQHKMDKALLSLTKGFAAIASADEKQAKLASQDAMKLLKGHKYGEKLAVILAAETDQLAGNLPRAEAHFATLLTHKPTEFLALKGLLVSAQAKGDIETSLDYAERAYAMRPDGKGIARILLTLYKRTGSWEKAEKFLNDYSRKRRFSLSDVQPEIDLPRERAAVAVMRARELAAEKPAKAFTTLYDALQKAPDFLPAAELAATLAERAGHSRNGKRIIEHVWKTTPTEILGTAYLDLAEKDSTKKRIRAALKLVVINPSHPESNMLAARAYLAAEEYNAAKNHAKLALEEGETKRLCLLMSDIERALGDQPEAERWKLRADRSLPDAGWECRECYKVLEEWLPVCPSCHAMDKVSRVVHITPVTEALPAPKKKKKKRVKTAAVE